MLAGSYGFSYDEELAGQTILLHEYALTPEDAAVTRRIDWGDGSPIEEKTKGGYYEHVYDKAGTYRMSVQLVSGTETVSGTFPNGDTITIVDSVPPEVLSGKYSLKPTRVRVNEGVTLTEDEIIGDDAAPVFIFRTVDWGDGTTQEWSHFGQPGPHKYAKPGTYKVTVQLRNLQWVTAGTFPKGNTVTVTAGSPGAGEPGGGEPGGGEPGAGDPGAGDPGDGDPGDGEPGAGQPDDEGGSGGGDEGLPVTGQNTTVVAGIGLGFVLAGAGTLVALRRRRTTFVR
ncbi:LPXTG cell wall anchor domain-containing protein [Symbioplanes lichenis]|uniref:LPXTG cell wall anchor domain-containing protein n=1 Tax=Symbioplanes lichenis TaxID=1629072 RepID=UPI00273A0385|nr:LPXTG cell wall anchor domain-containing protein [Actinoplanes lichenis]